MDYDLKVFTENIEPEAVNQIYELLRTAPFENAKVRIMPDVHYGKGCVDCGMAIDPTRMVLLRRIIDATGAKIVLSTSWREHWSKDLINCDGTGVLINRIFSRYGLHIFDKTPELYERRETEIKS